MSESQTLLELSLKYTPYGKTIVITGGTKGIGRATIIELAKLRCKVFTCARSSEDLDELLSFSQRNGWDVNGIVADVSTQEGRKNLLTAVDNAFNGKLDVLINNVGMSCMLCGPCRHLMSKHIWEYP